MKIGVIGFGHLGKALVKGLLGCEGIHRNSIAVTARSQATLDAAVRDYGVQACASNAEAVERAEVLFLTLPPAVFRAEQASFSALEWQGKTVVSLMAGISLQELNCCKGAKVLRAMPNLGIAENKGVIGYTATEDKRIIELLDHLGYAFCVAEKDLAKVTAFASSGVGFAAYILDAFVQQGCAMGFDRKLSRVIAANIFENALRAADYAGLVKAVATPGGTTEAGIMRMEQENLRTIVACAVNAAYQKMQ